MHSFVKDCPHYGIAGFPHYRGKFTLLRIGNILGHLKVSIISRCPHYRSVHKAGFHCTKSMYYFYVYVLVLLTRCMYRLYVLVI